MFILATKRVGLRSNKLPVRTQASSVPRSWGQNGAKPYSKLLDFFGKALMPWNCLESNWCWHSLTCCQILSLNQTGSNRENLQASPQSGGNKMEQEHFFIQGISDGCSFFAHIMGVACSNMFKPSTSCCWGCLKISTTENLILHEQHVPYQLATEKSALHLFRSGTIVMPSCDPSCLVSRTFRSISSELKSPAQIWGFVLFWIYQQSLFRYLPRFEEILDLQFLSPTSKSPVPLPKKNKQFRKVKGHAGLAAHGEGPHRWDQDLDLSLHLTVFRALCHLDATKTRNISKPFFLWKDVKSRKSGSDFCWTFFCNSWNPLNFRFLYRQTHKMPWFCSFIAGSARWFLALPRWPLEVIQRAWVEREIVGTCYVLTKKEVQ